MTGSELNQSLVSSENNANMVNVLTDFQVQLSNTNLYNPVVYYTATNPEERMIDLRTTQPMNTVDIKVYWRTPFNDLVPLYLHSNCSASIKILFRHKRFNSG